MPQLVEDHRAIAAAVTGNAPERAVDIGMIHLSRLDDTILRITETNANYFTPDEG
jgi:DNA-binding GntR family transcriptional regulator